MLQAVFIPNRYNSYAWTNAIGLMLFLCLGKIEPYTIVFGYFLETIIIGFFTIIKMYITSKYDEGNTSIWFLIPFFIFHYGIFVAVQSVFAFVIIGMAGTSFIKEPFDLILNYTAILKLDGMEYVIPLLFGTQVLKLIFDFMLPQKYTQFKTTDIMTMPYVRIFIQQFTVILAMFFIIFSNAAIIAAILLMFFRAIVDFFMVGIRANEQLLNVVVNRLHNGKTSKEKLKKQLLLFSE